MRSSFFFIVVASCMLSVASYGCGDGSPSSENVHRTSAAIIGGEEAPTLSAVVSIGTCSGALIAPNVILSAAHCVGRPDASGVLKSVGRGSDFRASTTPAPGIPQVPSQWSSFELTVTEVHVPKAATTDGLVGNDVSLLVLEKPVDGVTPLVPNFELPKTGDVVDVAGYGATCADCDIQEAIKDGGAGRRRERSGVKITCSGDCAGGTETDFGTGRTTAFFDSGGPVRNAAGQVLGTVSRGQGDVDIYQGLGPHHDFIAGIVRDAATKAGAAVPAWAALPPEDGGSEGRDDAGIVQGYSAPASSCNLAMSRSSSTLAAAGLALALATLGLQRRSRRR